jgi:hypothetical protein
VLANQICYEICDRCHNCHFVSDSCFSTHRQPLVEQLLSGVAAAPSALPVSFSSDTLSFNPLLHISPALAGQPIVGDRGIFNTPNADIETPGSTLQNLRL